MKDTKKIILASIAMMVLGSSVFAFNNSIVTWNVVNSSQSISNQKNGYKQFIDQLHQLKEQLKNAKTLQDKIVVKKQIVNLLQEYYNKYPVLIGRYIHADFHLTEKQLKQSFKQFKEQKKQQLKQELTWAHQQLVQAWKTDMKWFKKGLQKSVRDQIKEIWKQYSNQIKQLRESFKRATKEQRKSILQQIRQLRIERLEKIESLLPADKQQKVESYIEQLKQHFNTVEGLYQNYKASIQQQKEQVYSEISEKLKQAIDTAVANFEKKISTLPTEKQEKILNKVLKRINKIIAAHEKGKQNHNSLHFKTEIWILNYLQQKIEQFEQELGFQKQQTQDSNIINQVLNSISK